MEGKLRSKMYESREKTGGGLSEVLRDVASNQQDHDNERQEVLPVGIQKEEIIEQSSLMIFGNSNGNEENQADNYANNSETLLNNEKLPKSFPCRMRDCQKRFFHKAVYKKHKKRHIRQNTLIRAAPGNGKEKKNQGVSFQNEKINIIDQVVNDAESKHEEEDDDGSEEATTKLPTVYETKIAEVTQSATFVSGTGENDQSIMTETQALSPTFGVPPTAHHSRTNPLLTQHDSVHARTRSKVRNEMFSNQESSLNVHAKTQKGKKVRVEPLPFKCEICDRKFRSKSSYYRHMARVHKPHKYQETCPTCAKVFNRKDNLQAHIAQVHANRSERKFQCPIEDCGKSFLYQAYLTRHMVVHESPNPLTCPTCGTVFKSEQTLQAHICQDHRKDSKRKFQCPIENCGKRFLSSGHVKRHRVMHESSKELPCPNCDTVFKSEQYLKEHIKKFHAKGSESMLQCPEKDCESSFRYKSQLEVHMKSHTQEKLFMCDYCGKRFGRGYTLNNHVKTRICRSSAAGPSSG